MFTTRPLWATHTSVLLCNAWRKKQDYRSSLDFMIPGDQIEKSRILDAFISKRNQSDEFEKRIAYPKIRYIS
ncbi:hypothetical protein PM082_018657 [Marasmius tenuissimus]|nr:hypothetical protein PM082_018657 [Marasmius tenuissimus]